MSRKKRKNKGPRSGKLHKALCEKDVKCPGYARGGMFKLRFDRYIMARPERRTEMTGEEGERSSLFPVIFFLPTPDS